jgi:GNAT superfamily N-acetyltransferase
VILSAFQIRQATVEDVDLVAPLFDAYRQFYKQPSDLQGGRNFILERLSKKESIVFLAVEPDDFALGFVQLYPLFSSTYMKRLWILNDLFVLPSKRKCGVGRALMKRAEDMARETRSRGLLLRTAKDNFAAQKLYESCGWQREEVFVQYHFYF